MIVPMSTVAGYEADVVLADGGTVHLRPIQADDAAALVTFHDSLSEQTIYFRFFTFHPHLSEREILRFTQVDGVDRVAIVATLAGSIVAVARYDRLAMTDSAEVAFVVADQHQGRGLGTLLLEHLAAAARTNGITRFVAETLAQNRRMVGVFQDAGFQVTTTFEPGGGVLRIEFPISPTAASLAAVEEREHRAEARSVGRLFQPRSVALIGPSTEPGSVGDRLLANLLDGGFDGPIYAVHPSASEMRGIPAWPSVTAIPGEVDLVVIAVPAPAVADAMSACAAKGVHGVVVVSAGFGEIGAAEAEAELVRIARASGMRLVGPNCIGILDTATGLNATFAPFSPRRGNVAFLTQSGSLGIALLERSNRLGLGVSSFASVGNKADVSGNDLLQYWEDDPATDVVLLYLESFGNPRKFSRIARRVSARKPIVAVKAGRSNAGRRAAASHTAAQATPDTAVDALFEQAGVIRVDTLDQLFDVGQLLAHQPLPAGNRVGLLTNGGGLAILASDACDAAGLVVPELSPEVRAQLAALLGPNAATGNPVDMLASASPDAYGRAVDILMADPTLDALVVMFTPATADTEGIATALAQAAADSGKPVLAVLLGVYDAPSGLLAPSGRRVPLYPSPEPAVLALARAVAYVQARDRPAEEPPSFVDVDRPRARRIIEEALAAAPDGTWLAADNAYELLTAYGVPFESTRVVTSATQAVAAARELGFPVALKVANPDIVHKTDVGGVRLGLRGGEDVRAAFVSMKERLGPSMGGAVVQPMAPAGVETIIGTVQDPRFGPLLMFGLGGVTTEVLGDRAFRLVPMSERDASDLIESIRGAPLLHGYRGAPPVDLAALRTLLLRIGLLADDCAEIVELDLNPVVAAVDGVVVVDAKIRVAPHVPGPPDVRRMR